MAEDPADIARGIISASLYMVLATAYETGRSGASPVYFANSGYAEFFWVSSPDAAHSRNIAVRPQVSIVIFNSQVPIGAGQGVYMAAVAHEVTGAGLDRGLEVFSRRSLAHGGAAFTREDVQEEAGLRLYRATAQAHSILAQDARPDHRIAAYINPPGPGRTSKP